MARSPQHQGVIGQIIPQNFKGHFPKIKKTPRSHSSKPLQTHEIEMRVSQKSGLHYTYPLYGPQPICNLKVENEICNICRLSGSTGASLPGSGVNTPSTSSSAVPGTSRGANGSGGSGTSSLQQTQPPQQEFGHCPKARDGPALGCNYCWNSTDPTNGRILRRKTK